MSGTFDNKGSEGKGQRPTPTIEGTATEVSVEPESQDPESQDPESQEPGSQESSREDPPAAKAEEHAEPEGHAETEPRELSSQSPEGSDSLEEHEAGAAPARRSLGAALWAGVITVFSHALAGLLGALAVLIAIASGHLPLGAFKDAAGIDQLEGRVDKLETAPAAPDNSAALDALKAQLGALENRPPRTPEEVTALAARVAKLETSLKSMAEATKDGSSVADAAAISRQINAAEQRLDEKLESEIGTALAETKAQTAADAKAIDGLKAEIGTLDAKLKALAEAKLGTDDTGQLMPEITALDERVGKIESMLPALSETAEQESAETRKATLAIAFAGLREAVNEGRPYSPELATLAVLSPGALDLGSLLDYEDTGIPTVAALTASFETLRDEALAASGPGDDGSLVGQLLGSAESLVKIKRIGEAAEGSVPDAVLARAEAKLKKGDLQAAVADVATLQGPTAETFSSWLDEARARLDARATLRRLQNILLVSLGPSGGDKAKNTEGQE